MDASSVANDFHHMYQYCWFILKKNYIFSHMIYILWQSSHRGFTQNFVITTTITINTYFTKSSRSHKGNRMINGESHRFDHARPFPFSTCDLYTSYSIVISCTFISWTNRFWRLEGRGGYKISIRFSDEAIVPFVYFAVFNSLHAPHKHVFGREYTNAHSIEKHFVLVYRFAR